MHQGWCYKLNFPRAQLLSCIIKGAGGSHVIILVCIKAKTNNSPTRPRVEEQLQQQKWGKPHLVKPAHPGHSVHYTDISLTCHTKHQGFSSHLPPKLKLAEI